ncbi:MAG: sulfatase-like hydrolase/transferase [Halioglobus sp.]
MDSPDIHDTRAATIAAPVVILLFPCINLLVHHQYDLLSLESFFLFSLAAGLGCLIGVVALTYWAVQALCLSFLSSFVLVLQLNTEIQGTLVIFVCLLVLCLIFRRVSASLIIVFFGAMTLTGMLRGSENLQENADVRPLDSELPIYIHLIFDAHIGLEGIPTDIPGGTEAKDALSSFLDERGFTSYPKAYSRYISTANSISNLFNFTSDPSNYFRDRITRMSTIHRLEKPKYFEVLRNYGYALRILHPQYIDYCSANSDWVSSCSGYPNYNLLSLQNSPASVGYKVKMMLQVMLDQSFMVGKLYFENAEILGLPELEAAKTPGVNDTVIDSLLLDIEQHPAGYAFVVHLLTPHSPYVYDENCNHRHERSPADARGSDPMQIVQDLANNTVGIASGNNSDESRARRYQNYFDQMACTRKWFDQILATLEKSGVADQAVIVAHSDHGSGVSRTTPLSIFNRNVVPQDIIDHYSSFFATRGVERDGSEGQFLALEHILAKVVRKALSADVSPLNTSNFIYMERGDETQVLDRYDVRDFLQLEASLSQQ